MTTLVYSFLHSIFGSLCLFIVVDMTQDTTIQIKGSWRFLYSAPLYINTNSSAFDALTAWNDLPDDVCSVPILTSFRRKLKSYLLKSSPF